MQKNYILYKDYEKYNLLGDKKIDIYSPELVIMKKGKNYLFSVEPLIFFNGYASDLLSYVDKLEERNHNLSFMIKIDDEEKENIDPIFVKTFEVNKDGKLSLMKTNKTISLLDTYVTHNMRTKDIEEGKFVKLKSIGKGYYSLNIINNPEDLHMIKKDISDNLYFYTNNEKLLDKYSKNVTKISELSPNKYVIEKEKLFIIDSIGQDRIYHLPGETLNILYNLCDNALPIYITEKIFDSYSVSVEKSNGCKKGYLIDSKKLYSCLYNSMLEPLFKYINVYDKDITDYDKINYKKINIEDYLEKTNILKYIKKPSKN